MAQTMPVPTTTAPARTSAERLRARWQAHVPTSSTLPEDEWSQRHRIVVIGYALAAAVAVATTVSRDVVLGRMDLLHELTETAVVIMPGLILFAPGLTRTTRQMVTTTGVLLACGLMVHGTGGLIESHFSYFVLLPLIALYADWRTYLYAVLYVAGTHGIVGTIQPESMYNHDSAVASPVVWGVIHAAYVVALSVVMVVHWNFSDRRRMELQDALDDLRTTQSQLVESQKLESIGSLAAGVAHEINTPIQFVGDNLRFLSDTTAETNRFVKTWFDLQESLNDPSRVDQALSRLRAVAEDVDLEFAMDEMAPAVSQSSEGIMRVAEIVKAMKGFSHPKNDVAPCDLNELIRTTATVSRSEWKYVAELDLDLADDLPTTDVPPGSFNQVILNLIVNAAHAIKERAGTGSTATPTGDGDGESGRGRIVVTTRQLDEARVQVSVADNGSGMSDGVRDRVFEQFFTTKPVGQGTGQGLAIAHSLITGLGGRIDIDTEVGVGTTFTITLPFRADRSDGAVRRGTDGPAALSATSG